MTGDRAEEIAKAKLNLAERALFKAGGMLKVTDSTAAIQNLSKLWMPLGKRVVIIGAGLVGLELAEFLLDRGREVTVLDPGTHPGTELAIVRRWRVYDAVKSHGKLLMQSNVTRIERKEVVWTDKKARNTARQPTPWCWPLEPRPTPPLPTSCNPLPGLPCAASATARTWAISRAPCIQAIRPDAKSEDTLDS
jgi:hypothetical protein